MTGFVRRLAVGLACAALVVATGCGGDDSEPKASPTSTSPTPSEAPSESESPAELEMPDEAKKKTQAGAHAFLRRYVAAMREAVVTGDFSVLDAHSSATCDSCENAKSAVKKIYAQGQHIKAGDYDVSQISRWSPPNAKGHRQITLVYQQPRETIFDGSSKVSAKPAMEDVSLRFQIAWTNEGRWEVQQWTLAP